MSNNEASRPLLVTIVGGLYFLVGLIALIFGALMMANIINISDVADLTGAAGIVSAVICVIVGYGLLKGWKVMWYLGVIFSAIGLILGIVMLIVLVGIVPLIINAIILYYLFRSNVKAYFGI